MLYVFLCCCFLFKKLKYSLSKNSKETNIKSPTTFFAASKNLRIIIFRAVHLIVFIKLSTKTPAKHYGTNSFMVSIVFFVGSNIMSNAAI